MNLPVVRWQQYIVASKITIYGCVATNIKWECVKCNIMGTWMHLVEQHSLFINHNHLGGIHGTQTAAQLGIHGQLDYNNWQTVI
jgi:hypothetical protein